MQNDMPKSVTPKPYTVIPTTRQIALVRYSSCGKYLIAAGRDAKIRLWDVTQPLPQPEPAPAAEPPKKNAKPVKLPDPEFKKLPELEGHDGWVSYLAVDPKQPRFFSADTWGRLTAWSLVEGGAKSVWNLKDAHDGWVRQIAVTADGERLASCGKDKAIRLWSTMDGQKIQELAGNTEDVFSVAFHPDGKSLVTGDLKGIVKHWDLASGKVTREFDAKILFMTSMIQDVGGVRVLTFDTDGKTLAVAGAQPSGGGFVQASPTIKWFQWEDGKEIQLVKLGENTEGYVHDLQYHPQGIWIGACSGQPGRGRYFLHRTGEAAPAFVGDKQMPNCHSVAIHPSGERFVVVANEGTFGQRKSMAREGIYPGNSSPIHMFDLVLT